MCWIDGGFMKSAKLQSRGTLVDLAFQFREVRQPWPGGGDFLKYDRCHHGSELDLRGTLHQHGHMADSLAVYIRSILTLQVFDRERIVSLVDRDDRVATGDRGIRQHDVGAERPANEILSGIKGE